MSKQNYTITELKKELNQERHNIRRKLDTLGIKAINEDKRAYKTEPLKYNYQALLDLAKEFEVELSYNNSYNNVQGVITNVQADNRLIEQQSDTFEEPLHYFFIKNWVVFFQKKKNPFFLKKSPP